ncbi:MAG: serine hydrolase [Ignavibacteriales bacterium]|nr:serine hydrolase [Ignavibacteriales bacterium]
MKTDIITQAVLALLVSLAFVSCAGDKPVNADDVRFPQASAQNIDATRLAQAYDEAKLNQGVMSLLVVRNGVLVGEEYFRSDGREVLYHVRSVTKSVVSILFGIAVDRGMIRSLDATVNDYLGDSYDAIPSITSTISIRNLLTMSGGFQWEELQNSSSLDSWYYAPDHVQHALQLPVVNTPGTTFTYNTAACQLLSAIFKKATGVNLLEFARQNLFEPLGMMGDRPWMADERGYNYGGYQLSLKPMDMVNIGLLYLNEGEFGGRRIVSADWVRASTRGQISTNNVIPHGSGYGYLWWIGRTGQYDYYFANGYGGQFIVVVPALRLVVVTRSNWTYSGRTGNDQWMSTIEIIMNSVLPAVR